MRSLTWKLWAALLFASLSTFAISTLVITQWHRFESFSEAQGRPHALLHTLAADIEEALSDRPTLASLLQENLMTKFGTVYLIDTTGADVLNRPIPVDFATSIPDAGEPSRSTTAGPRQPPIFARAIRSAQGEVFFMMFRFDAPEHPAWAVFRWFGLTWVLAASILISGLFSIWLAHLIVRPIRQLSEASERHGDGELDTHIDHKLLKRQDELGALARQLKLSGSKIRSLMQQQRDFFRDISHEVRTPLARLRVAAESVEIDPDDKPALQRIQQEVETVDQLVQDVLHLSRLDQPLTLPQLDAVDLSNVVNHSVQRARVLAAQKHITIDVKNEQNNMLVDGVDALLGRALDNVLTNAIRYSPENSTVSIDCDHSHDLCCIRVCDQGPGVPEAELENIFVPFVRTDTARQRETGGFGLGLPLVKQIMQYHEGTVSAKNNRPCGLNVTLTVPAPKAYA